MFVLKSCNPSNPELMQIPAGQLYLVRPDSMKGSRECIYKDAVATIRRTSVEFQYQLVITRAYDEGEEQLLEEDAESEDERVFLLDAALSFRSGILDGDITFAWRDLSGDPGDMWEFVVNSKAVPRATSGVFEMTVLQCMYERKYQKSHNTATEADLEALKWKPAPKTPAKSARMASRRSQSPATPETLNMQALQIADSQPQVPVVVEQPATPEKSESEAPQPEEEDEDPFKGVPILHRENGELYLFDVDVETFVLQEKEVTVDIAQGGDFDYWLVVRQGSIPFISVPLDSEMVPRLDPTNFAFMFSFKPVDGEGTTWCVKFAKEEAFTAWKSAFTQYMWEGRNKMSWAKAKADEQKYVNSAYDDVEMEDVSNLEDVQEEEEEEDEDDEEQSLRSEEEESDEEDDSQKFAAARGGKNEKLTIGYKHDRSFVTRGDMIGVFKHTDDNQVKFTTSINRVSDLKGKTFKPGKIMLHNQDSDMLLTDPNNKNAIYRMDLEYGKVVDEWKVHDNIQVDNILPEAKYAQMNPTQTLLGHSHNGLFRIDPRVDGNKLVESQYKQYASKNDFSAAATTESGKIAIASNKGDIRLFDSVGKNAKTALPALGDPILGVDVTADGRWLIATCKTYLLLIDTLIGHGRYQGSLGFDRSFPADAKPIPRRLQLKPEHLAYMQTDVNFTPARFNTGIDKEEKTIVTSTGPFVITWNFKSVKRGKFDDYSIRKYQSNVVADDFKFGTDKNVIVALEQDVFMVNKKQLQKPTRESLSTPVKQLRSRSQIVNSPY
ncbi:hypothetical protein QFC21_000258 [Naganishia friedmannii]|uniref:Uncharacterized protein n=1 Tax=Naganishia friedmannii TaxID=89922 RepID=A0ACC2WC21_9TREE|nr:hypothetical protein QFC21_000258 [Naganishia friedmannii]